MKKILILVCFVLMSIYGQFELSAEPRHDQVDSLTNLIKANVCLEEPIITEIFNEAIHIGNASNYTLGLAKAYKQYARWNNCVRRLKQADSLNRIALAYAQEHGDKMLIASIYSNNTNVLTGLADDVAAVEHGKHALYYSRESNDPRYTVFINTNLTRPYIRLGYLDSALYRALEAVTCADTTDNSNLKMFANQTLGLVYLAQGRDSAALEYFEKTLKWSQELKDSATYVNILQQMAGVHRSFGQIEVAKNYMLESLELSIQTNEGTYRPYIHSGLGDLYYQLEQYDSSLLHNEKALELATEIRTIDIIGASHGNIGSLMIKLGRIDEAIDHLKQGIQILEEAEMRELLVDCYKEISIAYGKSENYKEAYTYAEKHNSLQTQILDEKKSKQLTEIETKYETQKKETEINKLTQHAQIQDLKIKQQTFLTIGLGVFLLMGLGIGMLYYRQNKIRQKQAVTQVEQKLLRSQMNPHFLFNSLMAIQNYLFQNKPEEAGVYMSKFAKLMRQTLEHSREDFITLREELDCLENYIGLQQVRFKNKFDFSFEIDPTLDVESVSIPPMFAQPFVENAIEHGLSAIDQGGMVIVRFVRDDNLIRVEIEDNGLGLSQSGEAEPLNVTHKSLATQITKERIAIINRTLKRKIELLIENIAGDQGKVSGTQVKLMVPFKEY